MAQRALPQRQPPIKSNAGGERRWWFVLGREPLLSAAEIAAVFPTAAITYTPPILITTANFDPKQIIRRLGGTVKIAEEIASHLTEADLLGRIAAELEQIAGKIHFGISAYGTEGGASQAEKWGLTLKKRLKADGKSVRYVDNRGRAALSSVSVEKNGLVNRGREFLIAPAGKNFFKLAKTAAVQPFESFSERDYGRPGRDDKSGLLPPKLALMMINLSGAGKNEVLLDPFCGSGTVLTEAALLGYKHIIGSDISEKAVADSLKNWDWLGARNFPKPKIFRTDIKNIADKIEKRSVGAIVTEPYMGRPLRGGESLEELQTQADELADLYATAFEEFAKILKPNGMVIFIIPEFQAGRNLVKINCLDKIIKLGFKPEKFLGKENSLDYQRPGQHVRRVIYKFSYALI